jgi:hypothetical protein
MPPGAAVFGNEQTGTVLSTPAPYDIASHLGARNLLASI